MQEIREKKNAISGVLNPVAVKISVAGTARL